MVYAEFGGQTECIMGNSKIDNGLAPPYVSDLTSIRTKSSNIILDQIVDFHWSRLRRKCFYAWCRSFYNATPCLCNSLLAELRDIQSLSIFKRKLKTHLFRAG